MVKQILNINDKKAIAREILEALPDWFGLPEAREDSTKVGYSFMQVKTVQQGRYKEYDATNKFYISLGFKDFEIFPSLWNVQNPCQIYVMSLK